VIIAIDYDNTYTADPATFDKVIKLFQDAGHTVICVTGRDGGIMGDPVRASIGKLIPVVFAGPEWKRDAALKQGYKVDVWVDDIPNMISPQNMMSPRNIRGSNG
jgi:hypothetical protein